MCIYFCRFTEIFLEVCNKNKKKTNFVFYNHLLHINVIIVFLNFVISSKILIVQNVYRLYQSMWAINRIRPELKQITWQAPTFFLWPPIEIQAPKGRPWCNSIILQFDGHKIKLLKMNLFQHYLAYLLCQGGLALIQESNFFTHKNNIFRCTLYSKKVLFMVDIDKITVFETKAVLI